MSELIILLVIVGCGVGLGLWLIRKGDNETPVAPPPERDAFAALREAPGRTPLAGPSAEKVAKPPEHSPPKMKSLLGTPQKSSSKPQPQSINRTKPRRSSPIPFLSFLQKKKPVVQQPVAPKLTLRQQPVAPTPAPNTDAQTSQPTAINSDEGTASLRTAPWSSPSNPPETMSPNVKEEQLSQVTQNILNKQSDPSPQLNVLKEDYQRLERMMAEKAAEIQKLHKDLEVEQGLKKDFDKMKVILETELLTAKAKLRDNQEEQKKLLMDLQSKNDKIAQLEEQLLRFEKSMFKSVAEKAEAVELPSDLSLKKPMSDSGAKGDAGHGAPSLDLQVKADIARQVHAVQSLEKEFGIKMGEDAPKTIPQSPPPPAEKSVEEVKGLNKNVIASPSEEPQDERSREAGFLRLRPDVVNPEGPGSSDNNEKK